MENELERGCPLNFSSCSGESSSASKSIREVGWRICGSEWGGDLAGFGTIITFI